MLEDMLSKLLSRAPPGALRFSLNEIGAGCLALAALGAVALGAMHVRLPYSETVPASIETATIETAPTPVLVSPPQPALPPATAANGSIRVAGSRHELVRKLQAGLAAAGCYRGPVTGAWTSTSRKAMQAFVETVNASLPVERADRVLLALIEANPSMTCPEPCSPDARSPDACGERTRASELPPQAPAPASVSEASSVPDGHLVPAAAAAATAAAPLASEEATRAQAAPQSPAPSAVTGERTPKTRAKRRARPAKDPAGAFAKSLMKNVQKAFSGAF